MNEAEEISMLLEDRTCPVCEESVKLHRSVGIDTFLKDTMFAEDFYHEDYSIGFWDASGYGGMIGALEFKCEQKHFHVLVQYADGDWCSWNWHT